MANERKAKLFQNGGSQAVRLPAEFRFEGEEVYIRRDEVTGHVVLSSPSNGNVWKDFITFRDSLNILPEEADAFMADRPMNQPASFRSVFEDEA